MIKKALEYLIDLGGANILTVGGREYADREVFPVKPPMVPTLKVQNLESIVTYVKEIDDSENDSCGGPLLVHIEDYKTVSIKGLALGEWKDREIFMLAKAETPDFTPGGYYDAENFNIALQSMFLQNEDRDIMLKVVGNLKDEAVRNTADDGVSQVTTVRTGIASVSEVKVPNPVTLRPYRTFIEVEQPESKFIFRMREGGACALFEADGGAWKLDAQNAVYEYLKDRLKEEIESKAVILMQ